MEEEFRVTRADLVAAFTAWQATCTKDRDGNFVDQPASPDQSADLLIQHLPKR